MTHGTTPHLTEPPDLDTRSRVERDEVKQVAASVLTTTLHITTAAHTEVTDITDEVVDVVHSSAVRVGFALLFSRHTTCGLLINENETGFHADLESVLECVAPRNRYWAHDDLERRWQNLTENERSNGHSHLRSVLASHPTLTIPILSEELRLGRWQRVMLLELDGGRTRDVLLQVWGSTPLESDVP